MGGLVSSGNVLCGNTFRGGVSGAGTLFYVAADGSAFDSFYSFSNTPEGSSPSGDLVVTGGELFGTSFAGGTNGVGTIFICQTNGAVFYIRNFTAVDANASTNLTGVCPPAGVILSPSGTVLFGVASAGGFANGVIFSVTTNGAASLVLHTFTSLDSNTGTNTDGATPLGELALSGDMLYGTTSAGGDGVDGTVYSVDTNGNHFTTLHSFSAMDPLTGTNADGAIPCGGLILSNGVLYGTTLAGGYGENGVVFSIITNGGNFSVLHQFTSLDAVTRTNTDGARPVANLLFIGGTLYGTATAGGRGASGTVFSVRIDGSQFQTVNHFSALNPGNGTNTDGAFPDGDLVQAGTSLYGTASAGGFGAAGTVFRVPMLPSPVTNLRIIQ
jgi:uncharacterized repeat protein (TIGR03803 family)